MSDSRIKFREEFILQAFYMCAKGAKDKDLAKKFGVNQCTITQWKSPMCNLDFVRAVDFGRSVYKLKILEIIKEQIAKYEAEQ